jgi:hypothetical protein
MHSRVPAHRCSSAFGFGPPFVSRCSSRSGSNSMSRFGPVPPLLWCASRSLELRCARAGSGWSALWSGPSRSW